MQQVLKRSLQAFLMAVVLTFAVIGSLTISPDLALARSQITIFSENFDDLANDLPEGWTHTPPAGWSMSNDSEMSQGDPTWQGWTFTTIPLWKATDPEIESSRGDK